MADFASPPRLLDHDSTTVSVVIPVRNGANWVSEQLDAIRRQTHPASEVIVVNNASTDRTADVVGKYARSWSAIQLLHASRRLGAGYARNAGAEIARGEVLAFCDADDVAADNWLEQLLSVVREGRVAGGALDVDSLNSQTDLATVGAPFAASPTNQSGPVDFAPSGNLAVMRRDFKRIGGFAEDFMAGEDVDFSDRARRAGFEVVGAPYAVVRYRYRGTPGGVFAQRYARGVAAAQLIASGSDVWTRRSLASAARSWGWLLLRLPLLLRPSRRRRWIAVAGINLGRLVGSLRHRVPGW